MQHYKTKNRNRKHQVAAYFDKGRQWKVIVPKAVYNYLEEHLQESLPFSSFKRDEAYYFLSLVFYTSSWKKDRYYKDGFVPLNSILLQKASYKYKRYFDFFLKIELLEFLNYSTGKISKSFRYNYSKIYEKEIPFFEFQMIEFDESKFTKKLFQINPYAMETCSHLCQWIDEGIEIDFDAALKTVEEELTKGRQKFTNYEFSQLIAKAYGYYYSIMSIHHKMFHIRRNPKRDNRLHSSLTNMPKILRKHITYNGKMIKSLDVKNSQPYFMVLFLEKLNEDRVRDILGNIYDIEELDIEYIGIMFMKLQQILCQKEFQGEFEMVKEWILSGKFYESLEQYYCDYILVNEDTGLFEMYFYDKDRNRSKLFEFKTLRDLMKKLTLQILYTPLKRPNAEYKIFRYNFPKLTEVLELLKSLKEGDDNSYKVFPKILQHLEADCLLDYITYNLSKKYPEMPLWTIHDSICTTEDWFDCMEKETYLLFEGYTGGMIPQLMAECWCSE